MMEHTTIWILQNRRTIDATFLVFIILGICTSLLLFSIGEIGIGIALLVLSIAIAGLAYYSHTAFHPTYSNIGDERAVDEDEKHDVVPQDEQDQIVENAHRILKLGLMYKKIDQDLDDVGREHEEIARGHKKMYQYLEDVDHEQKEMVREMAREQKEMFRGLMAQIGEEYISEEPEESETEDQAHPLHSSSLSG